MNARSEWILGVDGGGTNTVAWLAPARAQAEPAKEGALAGAEVAGDAGRPDIVSGIGQGGPANLQTVGFDAAAASVAEAIHAAFVDAGVAPHAVAAACLGLAGAGRAAEQQQWIDWAERRQLATRIVVTDDATPLLYAGQPPGVGVALISGTGSFSVARNGRGESFRCGGWGYLLGDEGSGYAIARDALRAATRAADGRGPATRLLDDLLTRLALSAAEELVARVYSPPMERAEIAQLADLVLAADRAQDAVAGAILDRAASELLELAVTAARKARLTGTCSLVMTGGVLSRSDRVTERVCRAADALETDFRFQPLLVEHPVQGALARAGTLFP